MMLLLRACLVLLAFALCGFAQEEASDTLYVTPKPSGPVVFLETFNGDHWTDIWKPSTDPKYNGDWEVQESDVVRVSGDRGLVVASKAKHHAIGALFPQPLDNTDQDLVVQYEVQFQHGIECGGAYMKLVTARPELDIKEIHSDTPYTIMFGPDKCGAEDKLHFIVRHENPITHEIEEKHLTPRPHIKSDKLTHLYTLYVRSDNTFEIYIDQNIVRQGSLLEDFQPPFSPPQEIDDPTDVKPADWEDEEFIPDPEATKPDDWDENAPTHIDDPNDKKPEGWLDDEPEMIPDPAAQKPSDWNDEEDGEWVAPEVENPKCKEIGCGQWTPLKIRNPDYKGIWTAPKITNPRWKGVWRPRQIPNPHYFEEHHPANFPKMAGIVFELWTMSDGILFDNILITHDKSVADDFAERTWAVKHEQEKKKLEIEHPSGDEETLVQTAERYLSIAYDFAIENPVLLFISVTLGLVPVFVCLAMSSPKKPAAAAPSARASSSSKAPEKAKEKEKEGSEKEDEIQADSGEETTKKSPTVRKRVPRADH